MSKRTVEEITAANAYRPMPRNMNDAYDILQAQKDIGLVFKSNGISSDNRSNNTYMSQMSTTVHNNYRNYKEEEPYANNQYMDDSQQSNDS